MAAIVAIATAIYAVCRWVHKQNEQTEEIEALNAELCVLSYAVLACLEGLKELGADGSVSDAHTKLEKHLNQRAHGKK